MSTVYHIFIFFNLEMTFGSRLRLMIDRWIGVHPRLSWMPHHSGCVFLRAPIDVHKTAVLLIHLI